MTVCVDAALAEENDRRSVGLGVLSLSLLVANSRVRQTLPMQVVTNEPTSKES